MKTVKYLHKYIYKGHDCANILLENDVDEIERYLHFRYVSPPESMWRILEFLLHNQSHTVVRLQIHLPDRQSVTFRENEEDAAVANMRDSMLLAWFNLNIEDENARQYLYSEIPLHYTWQTAQRRWQKRQRITKIATR
ncbi:uncharacterized protein B4U80_09659, partial [Leptotrombidium deliense]